MGEYWEADESQVSIKMTEGAASEITVLNLARMGLLRQVGHHACCGHSWQI